MMDKHDKPDIIDPMLVTESTEATDPAEPIERIEPAEPIERIDPVEPIERIDPLDPMLSNEPAEPFEPAERTGFADDKSRLVPMIAFSQRRRFRARARRGDSHANSAAAAGGQLSLAARGSGRPRIGRPADLAGLPVMAISIAALEAAAADGWRGTEEAALGGWLLRAADGFTGRANSALAVGDPGLPLAAAIGKVSEWYQARGLPAMIAVAYPLGRPRDSEVDRLLEDRGWLVRPAPATVMTAAAGAIARTAGAIPRPAGIARPAGAIARTAGGLPVSMDGKPDDNWLALYHYRGQQPPPVVRRLLMSAPWQAFGSVREAGQTLAVGRVAVAGDWAGLTAVEVHPGHRRRGLATAITAALAAEAAARGVTGIYLQVEDSNAAARALYHRVGFTDHHGYHYRIAPAA